MMIYSSQIWLRVLLNEAHNSLYGSKGSKNIGNAVFKQDGIVQADMMARWKSELPQPLVWDDSELPPTDLNKARLRAKYYGGLYMMLRPYLQTASTTVGWKIYRPDEQNVLVNNAHRCIECAIWSTIAFDRVGADPDSPYENFRSTRTKRLNVTNIFGTLHAYVHYLMFRWILN